MSQFSQLILLKISAKPLANLIVFMFFLNLFLVSYLSFDVTTLDAKFSYSQNFALDFIWGLSHEQRIAYLKINIADMLFAASYSLFIAMVFFKLFVGNGPNPKIFVYCLFLPVTVAAFDLTETFSIIMLNSMAIKHVYMESTSAALFAQVAAIATPIKWLGWLLIIFTYLFGLAWTWATARKKLQS